MRISVIGTGYVGIVSGACFAEIGHQCLCVDVDGEKVERINAGVAPIHELGLGNIIERHSGINLSATTDLAAAVHGTEVTFVAVGTPFDGQYIDLQYIREAARQIGDALKTKSDWHTVVVKSTVVPGTTDEVVTTELERASGKKAGIDFGVGMNPEFLTEGTAVDDFMRPDRIVIGGNDERSIAAQRDVYAAFSDTPTLVTNNKTAEMIKYASNSVLATLISFSNEIGNLCSTLGGVDVVEVMRGVHLARYFSTPQANGSRVQAGITSFLWAGCGYGGSCLPKDTKALAAHAAAHGLEMPLLDAVIATNHAQPARMIQLLGKHFSSLVGIHVVLLGLAFKEDTDDMRESPAIPLARLLLDMGAVVSGYDPIARETARSVMPTGVRLAGTLAEAIDGADALMLITRWDEFRQLPKLLQECAKQPLLVDGRRIIEPGSVPLYEGIGA